MERIFRENKPQMTYIRRRKADFPAHIHDDIELVYVKKGSGTACCDGRKYQLQTGSLFLAFPNQVHFYNGFTEGEYWVIIVKPSALLRYGQVFLEGGPKSAVCMPPAEEVSAVVSLLEMTYTDFVGSGFSDVIAAYLTAIFGKLMPFWDIEKMPVHRENVLKILQYCANHYKEDLSIESVAEGLSVSRSCVSHIFSDRIGMNFCDYVNSLRLNEAEELLCNKHYSVTEVASLSGFATIRTFNRAFRKKHGISPSAYRKNLYPLA